MGEKTGISWVRSSWSPWIGCTAVSPGCNACYAEALDKRHRYGNATHWGPGVPRHRTSASYWKQPLAWNKKAAATGERWTVFPSLCDPFDNEVPDGWRLDLFTLIADTPHLTYLLLTKRIGNVLRMQGGDSLMFDVMQRNVWLGASIVNQEEAYRDIPTLLAVPAAKRFVSYEPALGPVNFSPWLTPCGPGIVSPDPHGRDQAIDWIIVGGESKQGGAQARPFNIGWARNVVLQCRAVDVACFVKQIGSNPYSYLAGVTDARTYKDRAGANPAEWPADLRVQEFPA